MKIKTFSGNRTITGGQQRKYQKNKENSHPLTVAYKLSFGNGKPLSYVPRRQGNRVGVKILPRSRGMRSASSEETGETSPYAWLAGFGFSDNPAS